MGATDKYQLIVESVSRGDAELRRLEQVINKLADTTEKSQKRSADSYTRTSKQAADAAASQESSVKRIVDSVESGSHRIRNGVLAISAGVIATKQVFDGLSGSVDKFTAATLRSDAALSRTLATYRLTRLASSAAFGARALLGTAGTIGAGLAVEAVIRNARAQAEKVQAASLSAATTGNSFGGAYALTRAASLTGRDLGFLGGRSPEDVAGLNARLSGIADPIERATVAVNLFGKDAAAALTGIDDRLARQVKRAEELGAALDGPTREGLQGMSDFFRNFHPFDDLSDGLKNFLERGKIDLAVFAVEAGKAFRKAAKDSAGSVNVLGPDFEFSGNDQRFAPKSEKRFPGGLVTAEQFILDSRKTLAGQLANRDTGGFAQGNAAQSGLLGSATASIAAFQNSARGLGSALSESEARLGRLRKLFAESSQDQRGLLSEQIVQETKANGVIESRIKALEVEKALREKILSQQREFDREFGSFSGKILNAPSKGLLDEITQRGAAIRDGRSKDLTSSQIGRIGGLFDQREINRGKDAEFDRINGAFNEGGAFRASQRANAAFGLPDFIAQGSPANAPTLRRPSELAKSAAEIPDLSVFRVSGEEQKKSEASVRDILNRNDERDRSRRLQTNQQELAFLSRKLELLSGPGGERAAIEEIAKLKLAALQEEASVSLENFNVRDRQAQIERDRVLSILELQKKQRDAGREGTGRVFDALISGGSGGVGALIKSVGLSQVRTIAQNAGEKLTTGAGGFLGKLGKASGLGGLLGGTMFDPQNAGDPLKTATDANTAATNANTAALMIRGGGGAGVGGILSAFRRSNPAAFIPSSTAAFTPAGGLPLSYTGGGSFDAVTNRAAGTRNLQMAGISNGVQLNTSPGISNLNKSVGYAGAGLAGVLGAVNGFKAGGAQGKLSAFSSIAGAGASIIALAGVTGPAAPILAGIGLALAATAALIGDPKKNRDKALDRLVNDSRFTETQPLDYAFDTRGGGFDYNSRGDLRSMPINLTINALDSRSILDRGEDIASAVRDAMYAGHSINQAAQEVVLGV